MAARPQPSPSRRLSPPPSPTSFRRSPTPEPIPTCSALRGEERQRSNIRPRALQRQAQPDSAASSQRTLFGGGVGGTMAPPQKEYALSVQEGSGRSSPASLRSIGPILGAASTTASSFGGPRSFRTAASPSGGSTLGAAPVLKGLDSYSSRNMAAALEGGGGTERQLDDVWQSVCVRVLPLFNGEGLRGYVEDLNGLVNTHVQRTIARSSRSHSQHTITADVSTLVTGLLISDLTELISIGCLTLCAKLAPATPTPPLSDDKFLARLTELWSFYWTGVCPQIEAVFWVLRCDGRLKASVGGTGREREREGRTLKGEGRIDVRKLALIGFRDHLILPNIDRIIHLFRDLYESRPPSRRMSGTDTPAHPAPPSTTPAPPDPSASPTSHLVLPSYSSASTILPSSNLHPPAGPFPTAGSLQQVQAANARRRQMVAILASVLTNDQRQMEIDALLRTMRLGTAGDRASVGGSTSWAGGSPAERQRRSYAPSAPDAPLSENLFQFAPRSRAGTMESSDAEQAAGGSMTPQAVQTQKRRGFLPLLGRTKSGESNLTSLASTVMGGMAVSRRESDEKLKGGVRGRGWSGSGKGEDSEGTMGSDRGSFR